MAPPKAWPRWFCLLAVAIALVVACSDAHAPPANNPTAPATATVTPEAGGTIASADGRVKLVVPPHAVASATAITIAPLEASKAEPDAFPAGIGYTLSPDGLQFLTPATVT